MGKNGMKAGLRKGSIVKQMRVHASPYQIGKKEPDPQEMKVVSDEAARKALEIIQAAQARAKLIEKEGYDRGLARSTEALEAEKKGMEEKCALKVSEGLKNLEGDLIELVIAVAKKVIHAEVQQNKEGILVTIREGLARLGAQDTAVVRVPPMNDEGVKTKISDAVSAENKPKKIDIQEDKQIEPGGCVIESGPVIIDARVETQLENIKESLIKAKDGTNGA
jgi:flagellar assembly protein FliH